MYSRRLAYFAALSVMMLSVLPLLNLTNRGLPSPGEPLSAQIRSLWSVDSA